MPRGPKSWLLTLIEKLPKIILSTALLVAVCRANSLDLPTITKILCQDGPVEFLGWIVAAIIFVLSVVCIALMLWLWKRDKK